MGSQIICKRHYHGFTGYEERSYSERIDREDGSRIDIAACARKDAPGMVAIYYYTSSEFVRIIP